MVMDPEDLMDDPDDDEEVTPQATQRQERDNRRWAELRKAAKRLKEIEPEYEALKAFRNEQETRVRTQAAEQVFTGAGLPPQAAALFLREHEGEVTEGAALQWAKTYGIAPATEEEESSGPAFVPTPQGASPPPPKLTRSQYDDMLRSDPPTAFRAWDEGRVDMSAP